VPPEAKPVEIFSNNPPEGILYLRFPDFDEPYIKGYPYNYLLFDEYNTKDILRFVTNYKDKVELIICQCEAGVSRSAGVAGALSRILNRNDFYRFEVYKRNGYRTLVIWEHELKDENRLKRKLLEF